MGEEIAIYDLSFISHSIYVQLIGASIDFTLQGDLSIQVGLPHSLFYPTLVVDYYSLHSRDDPKSSLVSLLSQHSSSQCNIYYPQARAIDSEGVNLVLPKLYAFSMMWTLNAGHDIRRASKRISTLVEHDISQPQFKFGMRRRPVKGDMERGSVSGTYVPTESRNADVAVPEGYSEESLQRVHPASDTPVQFARS
ncbi:hypothetical protein B0H10DRAFT_1942124 [Mycena sp. CBHHK59/15]|nr:hypothetical protein B0H10DRAFT_1942124 [Mycena sp. CBHHK59/15]